MGILNLKTPYSKRGKRTTSVFKDSLTINSVLSTRAKAPFAKNKIDDIRVYCRSNESAQALACTEPTSPPTVILALEYIFPSFGTGLGARGFSAFDSDADGYLELLFASGSNFDKGERVAAVEYNPTSGIYEPICMSSEFDSKINRLIPFQNATIHDGTLIGLANGELMVMDHNLGQRTRITAIPLPLGINDMALGDIDNDGAIEIVLASRQQTVFLDADTYAVKGSIPYGGASLAIGHLVNRQQISVAYNGGTVVTVTPESETLEWDYTTTGFSDAFLKAGDIDGDGLDEIVGADKWYTLRAFNADDQTGQWEIPADLDIKTLELFDTNSDGILEVMYGDGQTGFVHTIDGVTGQVLNSVKNPNTGVTGIFVGDLDLDDNLELVWGAGYQSTGPDYLYIHEIASGQREFSSVPIDSPYYAATFGDINDDGAPDRVFASYESQSGYNDGIVTAVAYGTDRVLWQTGLSLFSYGSQNIYDVLVMDIDEDGHNEVVVASENFSLGTLFILDGSTGALEGAIELDRGSPIYSLALADVDGDNVKELIAGGSRAYSGDNGVAVYVIEPGTMEWVSTYPNLTESTLDMWTLEVADIDNDGTEELISLMGSAYIIDPDNDDIRITNEFGITAATAFTDGTQHAVYLADFTGNLLQLNADASTTLLNNICLRPIDSIQSIDANRNCIYLPRQSGHLLYR